MQLCTDTRRYQMLGRGRRGKAPGRQDRGGSAASSNGPGSKNHGWAGKGPSKLAKGKPPPAGRGKR
ncbi:TPA: hypothetical protein DIV49_00720 [Candidatus Saccharibacteria bacterium]|nr:hypothetical protein [Candidatus Saccharibacteria bacterium]